MTTDEFYKNIYNKLNKMETHIIWKKESMVFQVVLTSTTCVAL